MRTVIPALLLVLALVILGLALRQAWLGARATLIRSVELGPFASGLVPLCASAALVALVAAGGITRLALP